MLTMVADGDRPTTALIGGAGVVVLDVDLTPELEAEGQARDLIRLVQQARRDADLAVSDRIDLRIVADAGWVEVVRTHEALIAAETLATVAGGRRLGHGHAPDHRPRAVLTARPTRSATRSAPRSHVT